MVVTCKLQAFRKQTFGKKHEMDREYKLNPWDARHYQSPDFIINFELQIWTVSKDSDGDDNGQIVHRTERFEWKKGLNVYVYFPGVTYICICKSDTIGDYDLYCATLEQNI